MRKNSTPGSRVCHIISAKTACIVLILSASFVAVAQETAPRNDVNAPLHLMKPDYPTPYGKPATEDITKVLDRVFSYLDSTTPARLIDSKTTSEITDLNKLNNDA